MKKTENQLATLFEGQISFIFEEFKKLPNYGQTNPTFIARPRKSDTYDKIKSVLASLSSDIVVESFKGVGNAHVIRFNEDSKVVIIYAKDEADFKWLYNYHSYSSSIIIGKMLKSAGLKYSEDGLQYIQLNLRENHKSVVGSIDITKDFYKTLELLGLNISDYENGFSNTEGLFNFITKSQYFHPDKFINPDKEQRSIILQKLEEFLILKKFESVEFKRIDFEKVKSFFVDTDFETEISNLLIKAEKKKGIYDKLNGRVIMDSIPDFDTKKIGVSLGYFKHSFQSNEDYVEFLMEHSKEEVISKFKQINQLV